ncbi:MAG: Crp/Fnr family transcriptional regulator, partial [Oscillospiraceae bacterium]
MHMTNYHFLSKTGLFMGCTDDNIKKMLDCFGAWEKAFSKGEAVFRIGDTISEIGLVLNGSVNIERDDIWGNRDII